jgi:mannose/cellobiose epimerase-like protein (N-acyl-D-glucosamine 2-epimerase family)
VERDKPNTIGIGWTNFAAVARVTCYDHFFSILAFSMATAAILKKSTLKGTTSHGI